MLFYLTDSLIVDQNNPLYKGIYTAVHNLATQVVGGNHLLTADYKAIEHFRTIFGHDPSVGLLFNQLYQNYSMIGVPQDVTTYIEVVKDNPVSRIDHGRNIFQKEFSYYLNIDVCIKARLISEDLNDTIFYGHVLKWFISQTSSNYSFAFHGITGGGKNTYKVVLNELNALHITICIIDTDQKYPGCPPEPNGTYDNCVTKIQSTAVEYKLLPLDVHEIENIIPLNYIDRFDNWEHGDANDVRKKHAFDFLRNNAEEILPYFDYKKGIKKDDMFKNNPDYRMFVEKCYEANNDLKNNNDSFASYVDSLQDKAEIYPNLIGGTGTINRALEMILNNTCPQPDLLHFQQDNWMKIGQALLDWCIARTPEGLS